MLVGPFVLSLLVSSPSMGPSPPDELVVPEQSVLWIGPFANRFGTSLATDGATLVVGAPGEPAAGNPTEAAFVYARTADVWAYVMDLHPGDGTGTGRFGDSVAVDGDRLLVGAPLDLATGAAYVFERTGTSWIQRARILPGDGAAGDRFGIAVALAGDFAFVGAITDDDSVTSGTVYVFERVETTWSQRAKLKPEDVQPDQRFGSALAVDEGRLVVGAPGDDHAGVDAGAAYVFEQVGTAWAQRARLIAPHAGALELFGTAVDLQGSRVIVGAPGLFGRSSGRVLVYEEVSGTYGTGLELVPVGDGVHGFFGQAVALVGDRLVVGDPAGVGAVHSFEAEGAEWTSVGRFVPSDTTMGGGYGRAVAIGAGEALVGSPFRVDGFVYVHTESSVTTACDGSGSHGPCPCGNESGAGQGCLHSAGRGIGLRACGSTSLSADELVLVAEGCPPGNGGLFFVGDLVSGLGLPRFDGLQCVGGSVVRFRPVQQFDGVAMDTHFAAQDPSGAYFSAGATYAWQYWSRDAADGPSPCGTGANFSAAAEIVLAP